MIGLDKKDLDAIISAIRVARFCTINQKFPVDIPRELHDQLGTYITRKAKEMDALEAKVQELANSL